jgi:hypothetical protein
MKKTEAKAQLYVGCALTAAPENFKTSVEGLKDTLRDLGYAVFDFVGLVAGTPEDVYNYDIGHCVRDCDAFIAICDEPGIGLGWELSEATRLGKPVLAVAHVDAKISRLVIGAAEVEPNLHFERYNDLVSEVPALVETMLASQTPEQTEAV